MVLYSTKFVQKWTGSSFIAQSLKKLGLRVQLGHAVGEACLLPERAFNDDFTLIDSTGIFEIGLDYCGCDTAQTRTKQLLRAAWFPATALDPRTAATFRVLEQYHLLSFESKASGYEFYHAIARLTDNTGLSPQKVCANIYNVVSPTYWVNRIAIGPSYGWFGSGATLQCSNAQAVDTIPLEWMEPV
jgi:hypothetical protein